MRILIVDDEANIRKTLSYCLAAEGHGVIAVSNPADALAEARERRFDLAFIDLKLGEENGMDYIPALLASSPWMKVVVITAFASLETAVEAMKRGAYDYIAKPFTPDQVRLLTSRVERIRDLEDENVSLRENARVREPRVEFASKSASMQRVIETARKAAQSEATILIYGESGTGKSLLARGIHGWSPRAQKPFAVVACPSIPSELLESELFGHGKGAFTGATNDFEGRIGVCDGGTLFLDEIADLAHGVQAKLLRFLQDREYERLGESVTRKADVRVIAATNADLEARVKDGRFREDLFYRLNVIELAMPSLRERAEDTLTLADEFLARFSAVNHKNFLGFDDDAKAALSGYGWPGNVRELQNAIERAVILGSGETIHASDLPASVLPAEAAPRLGDLLTLAEIDEIHIRKVIAATSSLAEAAEVLGIDQATLWRRRKDYGI
ncbi:MAG: sigma-54 dependent transcriptional regulator [Planctomycetes bacterium]|nr:sigma-54 dependent transcriptional regulator [Planctomycetota bacterium]